MIWTRRVRGLKYRALRRFPQRRLSQAVGPVHIACLTQLQHAADQPRTRTTPLAGGRAWGQEALIPQWKWPHHTQAVVMTDGKPTLASVDSPDLEKGRVPGGRVG